MRKLLRIIVEVELHDLCRPMLALDAQTMLIRLGELASVLHACLDLMPLAKKNGQAAVSCEHPRVWWRSLSIRASRHDPSADYQKHAGKRSRPLQVTSRAPVLVARRAPPRAVSSTTRQIVYLRVNYGGATSHALG